MLQEAIDLQERAVGELVAAAGGSNQKITFKSPTGSGKTHMIADFMSRVLDEDDDIVFIVSTLSTSDLAGQCYQSFITYQNDGAFLNLKPFLITSDTTTEEAVFIPRDRNVYILPHDLYKDGGNIVPSFDRFLIDTTERQHKKIYLVRDESHRATNNLSGKNGYFSKIINISATPKRGYIDVEITEVEAQEAALIKKVEYARADEIYDDNEKYLDEALTEFEAIKRDYERLLGIEPAIIIQVSNKGKVEEELPVILSVLQSKHPNLVWAYIVNQDPGKNDSGGKDEFNRCDTNNKALMNTPLDRWKDELKKNTDETDVIIFKMAIKEGWDIPRACMLYQMRSTMSKTLDEQVVGRVRRNPRLVDFEDLTQEAQELCLRARVWGIAPESGRVVVNRYSGGEQIRVKTTKIKPVEELPNINVAEYLDGLPEALTHGKSIFELYRARKKAMTPDWKGEYRAYATDTERWFRFNEHLGDLKKKVNDVSVDYEKSMYIVVDEAGEPVESTLPEETSYVDDEKTRLRIDNWIWHRLDNQKQFAFDSEAECGWADILKSVAARGGVKSVNDGNGIRYLLGKNYRSGSTICFEYYSYGIHKSYPDFVMKDTGDRIHIFEAKSVNHSSDKSIDEEAYQQKIRDLMECYKQASKLTGYHFYIPIQEGDVWTVHHIENGNVNRMTEDELIEYLST